MRAQQLFAVAEKTAARLPGTVVEKPFGPDWRVYKVGGKVFMLVTEVRGEPMVIVRPIPTTRSRCVPNIRRSRPDIT